MIQARKQASILFLERGNMQQIDNPFFGFIIAAATGNGPTVAIDVISHSPSADSGFILAVNFANIPPSVADLIGKLKMEMAKHELGQTNKGIEFDLCLEDHNEPE
jgi:hypothetical protein